MVIEVIQGGETLWALAQRYGVSVESIVEANDIPNPDRLVVGQALVVPTENSYYTVNPGDTLWQIARRFGTSIEAIIRTNQIENPGLIYPGQELVIPELNQNYTVQTGDTLWTIAQAHGTSIQALAQANQIQNLNVIYPGQTLVIPQGSKPVIETNGYTVNMSEQGAEIVRNVGEHLTYLSPFSYKVRSDGTLIPLNDEAVLAAAREENATPMMVITNFGAEGFSSELANTILGDSALQEELITNILQIMGQKGYEGLNIDFEYVFPRDRENYNEFLRRVVDRLHSEGYFVSTALAPKINDEMQGLLYAAHDYATHGDLTDFVVLMTYEWGWAGGPPRAISPIPEMRRVLDYAVTVIPRDKILMGFSTYGRDWPLPFVAGETIATSVSEQTAVNLAAEHNVAIQYDSDAHAPHFRYYDQETGWHEVWYEDARTALAKYELVKEYQLRGVSYWVLSFPFPQNWLVLEDQFIVKKL
ncbi:MAG TPA: LysM peptidoglycan-binding domain-containing protein [Bacillales bacterium]|nr:LysM peptidoglycan-binding domain-containing protein [Bacillales bacterium]